MLANECMLEFKKAEKIISPPSDVRELETIGTTLLAHFYSTSSS
jgi:hypothetical protein